MFPLAKNGIFRTIQGEGAFLGVPMTFVRLAGCSIGCSLCDTDYAVSERLAISDIVDSVSKITPSRGWVWITGGEPTDHRELDELIAAIWRDGFKTALATTGHKKINRHVSWLSVSPHDPSKWIQKSGDELKIVPGLNGYGLKDFAIDDMMLPFDNKFVSPCDGKPETVNECVQFVESHPSWKMTGQMHKLWNLP